MYKIIESQKNDRELTLTIAFEDKSWTDEIETQVRNQTKKIKIAGFRVGKAPIAIARRSVNMGVVLEDAANKIIQKNYEAIINDKLISEDDEVIDDSIKIEPDKIDDQKLVIKLRFELIPEITLPAIDSIPNLQKPAEITEKDISRQIKNWMKSDATITTKEDNVVADGNLVTIDFEGTVDGKVLPEATASNYELEIGSKSFIDGFEDKLINAKKDETRILDLVFPKDYHDPKMSNKPVSFKVTVKAIKEIKYPELNNDYIIRLAKEEKMDNVVDVDSFKQSTKKRLEETMIKNINKNNTTVISNYLIDHSKFSYLPESLVKDQIKQLNQMLEQNLKNANISMEDFLKIQNNTNDGLAQTLRENSVRHVKFTLAFEELAKVNKIDISDDEVNAEIEKQLKELNIQDQEKLAAVKSKMLKEFEQIYLMIKLNKVNEFIINQQKQ
ncbi:trigger factor [Mycoplasma amphoriforme]|uniref:Trigger factor n=1 Tax=Mycoplasma amphoriforme A39 TaxID=572419 RepID=A0A292II99_9MOLU|nr:unnamed protein product [Mycoplasma amphoriforme A39]